MAAASGVIGSIAVNIVARTDQFLKGIARVRKAIKPISMLGSGITAALLAATKVFESTGSQLHDLSEATGISADKLSFLKYAAEQSGTSLEAITKAARELQSKGIDPNKFTQIAESIASIQDPTQRAQRAFAIFGKKAGFPILAMLKDLPQLKKRFQELGGGFTKEMADRADATGDAWGNLKLSLMAVANTVAYILAPTIIQVSEYLANQIASIRDWIREHPTLTKALAATAVGFASLIPIIYGVEKAVKALAISVALLQLAKLHPVAAVAVLGVLGVAGAVAAYKAYKGTAPEPDIKLPGIQMPTVTPAPNIPGMFQPESRKTAPAPMPTSEEIAKNTSITNDKMDQLIAAMKQAGKKTEPLPGGPDGARNTGTPVQLAVAGVR